VLVEFVAIVALWRGRRLRDRVVIAAGMLVPGALLLVCLRLALSGSDWELIAGVLALAGIAHVFDLVNRLRA
jgi:hypothetical protein